MQHLSQQARYTVISSSLADGAYHLLGSTISIDSVRCVATFAYCNSYSIDMRTGDGISTMMYCGDGRSDADTFVSRVIVEHGQAICDKARLTDDGLVDDIVVDGDSGSIGLRFVV